MNIIYKFSAKHLFLIILVILIFVFFTYHVSIREGQTSKSAQPKTTPNSTSDSQCDPIANIQSNPNDAQIGTLISDHVTNSKSTLDSYLAQLKVIQDKFRNVSSCLSIGTVNVSSENSIPVVTIDDPAPGTIKQSINYILPQGQRGDKGDIGPYKGASGLWGKKGANGTRGPPGENIIPNNIYNKVY